MTDEQFQELLAILERIAVALEDAIPSTADLEMLLRKRIEQTEEQLAQSKPMA